MRHLLAGHGRTLAEFNMPEPDERGLNWRHEFIPPNFDDLAPAEHHAIAVDLAVTLNNEQRVSNIKILLVTYHLVRIFLHVDCNRNNYGRRSEQ